MHKYISHTTEEINQMLTDIGFNSIEELFQDIPEEVKIDGLNLPDGLSEIEVLSIMKRLASKNKSIEEQTCFLGAGAYDHYIPTVIDSLISRQEFYTAYTPYQPEVSQGTLRAIFEFQTMICELTGLDVANASMYDAPTAVAEAMNMTCGAARRGQVLIAGNTHPETKKIVDTYAGATDKTVTELKCVDGKIDVEDLRSKMSKEIGCVIIQTPNFFGLIENIQEVADIVHEFKGYLVVSADPLSLGLLEAPGNLGADVVVGEAQVLGNSLSFGGPYVGYFSTTKKLMRKIPGRVVGETKDADGNRGYVLTLQSREQHIRREKATSNICSNQALCALISSIYVSVMGKVGIKEVATQTAQKSYYAREKLLETNKFTPVFNSPFFREFVLKFEGDIDALNAYLEANNVLGGYNIGKDFKDLKGYYLVAVTEKRTKEEIDNLALLISQFEV